MTQNQGHAGKSMRKDYRWLVTLACLAGTALSGAFLYLRITATGPASTEPVVGALAQRESSVRRKAHRSYHWEELQSGRTLHRKDVIRTGDGSYATLQLNTGKTLDLGPNSSVVLSESEDTVLESLRGQAIVRGEQGDQKISTGADGKKKIEALNARLIAPAARAVLFAGEKSSSSVELTWVIPTASAPETPPAVEISTSRGFPKDQLRTQPIATGQSSWSLPVSPGTYFWRIVQAGQQISEVRSFQVFSAVAMRPISPSPRQPIQFWAETGGGRFLWKNPLQDSREQARSTELLVQVAEDHSFSNPLHEARVPGSADQVRIDGLRPGRYFWRVLAKYGEREVPSPYEDFDVTKLDAPLLSLNLPASEAALPKVQPVRMSWSSQPPLTRYGITIEKVDDQNHSTAPVLSLNTLTTTRFQWDSVGRGVFRWKVDGYVDERKVGESAWRYLSVGSLLRILTEYPSPQSEVQFTPRSANLQFRWSDPRGSERALRFRLELAEDPEFKRIVKSQDTLEPRWEAKDWRLNAGTYHWRVLAVDPAGVIAGRSPSAQFFYQPLPAPAAPLAVAPAAHQEIDLSLQRGRLRFEWKAVPGATRYRVTLKQGGRVIQESPELTTPHWETVRPPLGVLSWSVVAIDEFGRPSTNAPYRDVKIKPGKTLSAPRAISSEVQ